MRYLLSLLTVAVMLSCSGGNGNFTVKCRTSDPEVRQLFLARLTLAGTIVTDSAMQKKDGTYTLSGYTDIPDFYIIYFEPDHYINLIISPGDKVTIDTRAPGFEQDYTVEGSEDSRLVQKMVTKQALTLKRITDISEVYENNIGKPGFDRIKSSLDSTYDVIIAEHRKFSIELIEENPGSLAALMTLYQQLGRNTPVFDYKKDFRYYRIVDSTLTSRYPKSEAVRDLNRKVTEISEELRLEKGSVAPEIVLPDTTGTHISLSSLRGRYVLLFFGASWSAESMRQNRILTDIYKRYGGEGLEFYQVSLDRTKKSWIRGIREEDARGIQVSDGKYWDSPVVQTYLVEKLPQLYLIDKEGVIIDKGFSAKEFENRFATLADNTSL